MSTVIISTTEALPEPPAPWCAFFDGPAAPDAIVGFGETRAQALRAFADKLVELELNAEVAR